MLSYIVEKVSIMPAEQQLAILESSIILHSYHFRYFIALVTIMAKANEASLYHPTLSVAPYFEK